MAKRKRTVMKKAKRPRIMKIRSGPTGRAMQRLVDQLDRADLTGLAKQVPGGKKRTARAWMETLKRATRELPGWCKSFSIDVPPKRRRRA
jgi:hypothetical protein